MLRCILFLAILIGVYVYLIFRNRYKSNNQRNKDDIALNTTSDELKRLIDKYGNSKVKHAENILNLDIEKDLDGINYRIRNNHDYLTQSIPQDVIDKLSNYLSSRSSHINNDKNKENIKQYKYCPQCGKRVLKSAHFCENCGYKFNATDIYHSESKSSNTLNHAINDLDSLSNNSSSDNDYFNNLMNSLDNEISNSYNKPTNSSTINESTNKDSLSDANTSSEEDAYIASTTSMKQCPNCKRYNDNNATKCKYCGYEFNNNITPTVTAKQKQHSTLVGLGVMVIAFLIIMGFFVGPSILSNYHNSKDPTSSTEQTSLTTHQKAEKECNTINQNGNEANNDASADEQGLFNGASVSGDHIDVDFNSSDDIEDKISDLWGDMNDTNGDKYDIPVNITMDGQTVGTTSSTDEDINFN